MSDEQRGRTALAVRETTVADIARQASTAMTLVEMRERVEQLDAFYRGLMQKGTDYDEIPGTNKPTLLQPGAQLACTYFGFVPSFEVLPSSIEDWERGFFALTVRCRLGRSNGSTVAEGIGACNSKEDKYRWRDQQPQCPDCNLNTLRRGVAKFGGGYYCAAKSGGCGANFKGGTAEADEIARQPAGRIENPEPWSLHNTILKMAEKRALVAATLNATGASRIFTQDVEDLPEFSRRVIVSDAPGKPAPAPDTAPLVQWFKRNWANAAAKAEEVGATLPEKPDPRTTRKAVLQDALNAALAAIQQQERKAAQPDVIEGEVVEPEAGDDKLAAATAKNMQGFVRPEPTDIEQVRANALEGNEQVFHFEGVKQRYEYAAEYERLVKLAKEHKHPQSVKIASKHAKDMDDGELFGSVTSLQRWEAALPSDDVEDAF